MPILGICGDSYMAATINKDRSDLIDSEGKHFTEILSKKIGYDYFTLARGACSNFAIRMQIDEMVRRKVDLVIVGWTSPDRIELPLPGKKFDPKLGVYNLDYNISDYPDRSATNENFRHNIMTETLSNIFHHPNDFIGKIGKDKFTSLENFYDNLYDIAYKSILDNYIVESGFKKLTDSKIPFVFTGNGNFENSKLNPWSWEKGTRRWHTTDEAQVSGAEIWYNYLQEHGYLSS